MIFLTDDCSILYLNDGPREGLLGTSFSDGVVLVFSNSGTVDSGPPFSSADVYSTDSSALLDVCGSNSTISQQDISHLIQSTEIILALLDVAINSYELSTLVKHGVVEHFRTPDLTLCSPIGVHSAELFSQDLGFNISTGVHTVNLPAVSELVDGLSFVLVLEPSVELIVGILIVVTTQTTGVAS